MDHFPVRLFQAQLRCDLTCYLDTSAQAQFLLAPCNSLKLRNSTSVAHLYFLLLSRINWQSAYDAETPAGSCQRPSACDRRPPPQQATWVAARTRRRRGLYPPDTLEPLWLGCLTQITSFSVMFLISDPCRQRLASAWHSFVLLHYSALGKIHIWHSSILATIDGTNSIMKKPEILLVGNVIDRRRQCRSINALPNTSPYDLAVRINFQLAVS